MKTTYLFAIILSFVLLLPNVAKSQAKVERNYEIVFDLINPNTGEVIYTLELGDEMKVTSASGNFLKTLTFKIPTGNRIMNFSGPTRVFEVSIEVDYDGDGVVDEIISDEMAVLTRSGNLKFVFLSNGAGSNLPPGWNF